VQYLLDIIKRNGVVLSAADIKSENSNKGNNAEIKE